MEDIQDLYEKNYKNIQADFIQNLKHFRKNRNLSQEALAERCDCSVSTIGNIESGVNFPSFELLIKFTLVLKVQLQDFFTSITDYELNPNKNSISYGKFYQFKEDISANFVKMLDQLYTNFQYENFHRPYKPKNSNEEE